MDKGDSVPPYPLSVLGEKNLHIGRSVFDITWINVELTYEVKCAGPRDIWYSLVEWCISYFVLNQFNEV